ncbi:MAG: transcription termination/antitermination protein NusA [Alkaliphilus sp.]|nr:MAG: transcription termination/antitermination protein NusA [Alkaliphilus sp.]
MNTEFISALEQIQKDKGISKEILIDTIEAALISSYKRNFGTSQNVKVEINQDTGDINVYSQKRVVEEVEDDLLEISLEDAKAINPNYELEDMVENEVTPRNFGRIAAQTAKQVVVQRIREAERMVIFEEFVNRESEIITGKVARISKGTVFVNIGKVEAILPQGEQMSSDKYNHGDRIKTYITEVKNTTKGPQIAISRTHPGLIKRLFELEVPEIHEGTVEIKSISREPGSRTKIAVETKNENVDAVGACVGAQGNRVQSIVDELRGEKIDIIEYSQDPALFISNALKPAKVIAVKIDEASKAARVIVPDYQLSLAIGKEGQNARLAAKLTAWKIDIKSESQVVSEVNLPDEEESTT